MAKNTMPTEQEVYDLLNRMADLTLDVSDMSTRLKNSFALGFSAPAEIAALASYAARDVSILAAHLNTVSRHAEDERQLRARLQKEIDA